MAYRLPTQAELNDEDIDQFRIARLGGAETDYQLAAIANEHPDWTPDQVRLAQQGKLGGAPSNRLLTGYGLPARYRITGADPQEQPPYSAINPRPIGRNSLADSLARQQNQFRLDQIKRAQSQLDKLDPTDDDNSDKISELKGRIEDFKSQAAKSPAVAPTPAAVPLGEGTAGEEAPVYKAGGPAAIRRLSNGGSIYFGPASGAPPFRVGAAPAPIQDEPAAGTVSFPAAAPTPTAALTPKLSMWSIAKAILKSGGGPSALADNIGNLPNDVTLEQPDNPTPAFKISPSQIKKRIAIQKQLTGLGENAPKPFIDAVNNKLGAFDSSVTNPPASFRIAPQADTDAALSALPDSGTITPPDSHIAALKANPDKAADFDALYGQGSAAKILGQ